MTIFVCRIQSAVADIFQNSAREEVGVLQDDAEAAPQVGLADFVDVNAVVANFAVGNVVEPVYPIRMRSPPRSIGHHLATAYN